MTVPHGIPDSTVSITRLASLFGAHGFRDPVQAATTWQRVWVRLPPSSSFARLWRETWAELRHSADPDLALGRWLRWIEADLDPSEGPPGARSRRWKRSAVYRRGFLVLSGISPALGDYLLGAWEEFAPESWRRGWEAAPSLSRRLEEYVAGATAKEFLRRTRRFRGVESLRIAYLDCLEALPVHQVTIQVSILADVLIQRCLEEARTEIQKRFGCSLPGGFVVLALGKLGGRELNYSSDIDLNFVYDDRIEALERGNGKAVSDPFEIERIYTKLAERLVALVSTFTEEGPLYRLDTRLRPGGASGRLVWSARASVNYYYSTGRAWERQALIRMRPIAGDRALAERFLGDLASFVFPASFSADEIAQLRGLKLQVEKIAAAKGPQESQLKIGQGGIRDVEYIVQFLQLIHGARLPALRDPNLFEVFDVLEQEGLMTGEETDTLRQGYRFLRRVEHRLQMAHFLQTHRLPDDPLELRRLARGLGFPGVDAFKGRLAMHASEIRRVYSLLFDEATVARPDEEALPALLDLPRESVGAGAADLLAPYGFEAPNKALSRLFSLAGEGRLLVDGPRSKAVFRRLLPKLLREISRQAEPDRTISNLDDCVRSLGAPSVFYQLLCESESFLQLFVGICARSSLLVEILRHHPDIFDEVVDALITGYTFDSDALNERVASVLRDAGDSRRELFNFKYVHLLLTAIRDLQGVQSSWRTMKSIAEIAEALLRGILQRSLKDATAKLGSWLGEAPRFLVLGLGKLGGQEMTYGSDVDVVFVVDGQGRTDRGIAVPEYYERFSQMVLKASRARDSRGPLLDVDVRLRPLGSHNSLVVSFEGLRQYFRDGPGETWERQAFLRARAVGGDPALASQVIEFIRGDLVLGGRANPVDAASLKVDMWAMRKKLQDSVRPDDLKRGVGGIVDVEFLVQAIQLLHGRKHPEILVQNTVQSLERIETAGLLTPSRARDVGNSYAFLRWIENRFTLVSEPGQSLADMEERELESLVQKIDYRSSGEESAAEIFRSELDYHRRKVREALLEVLEVNKK